MPFITQGKTNLRYILIIIILAIIVGGGVLVYQNWLIPEEKDKVPELKPLQEALPKDETANWKTYRNEKYKYEIKYPRDWRIAYSIMEWAIKGEKKEIEDWVMITSLSEKEEKEYLEALKSYDGMGWAFHYIENADGRAIIVSPVAIPYEKLKNPEPDVGWKNFDFREEETETGLKVIRLRAEITWEMYRDYEWAFIPYPGDKTLREEKITYIRLEVERNEGNYEKDVFEKMLSTLRFIEDETNWKIYRNEKLGFSIKYPKTWSEPKETILATRTEVEFTSTHFIWVGVVYDQEKQRELTYLEVAKRESSWRKEPQLTTVDGQPAAYLKMREEDLPYPKIDPFNFVTIQKGRNIFAIYYSLSTISSEQEAEQKSFDQMLSTFKFLD